MRPVSADGGRDERDTLLRDALYRRTDSVLCNMNMFSHGKCSVVIAIEKKQPQPGTRIATNTGTRPARGAKGRQSRKAFQFNDVVSVRSLRAFLDRCPSSYPSYASSASSSSYGPFSSYPCRPPTSSFAFPRALPCAARRA